MNKAFAFLAVLLTAAACSTVPAQDSLTFNPGSYTTGSLTLPTGKKVDFKAYEKLYFVANDGAEMTVSKWRENDEL